MVGFIVFAIIATLFVSVFVGIGRGMRDSARRSFSEDTTQHAVVVSRRPGSLADEVVFEFDDGERFVASIPVPAYKWIVVGDHGALTYVPGKTMADALFKDFVRDE